MSLYSMLQRLVSVKMYPKIRVKTVLVNPTKYYARPYLTRYNYKDNVEEHEEFSGNAREENRTVVEGYNVLKDDAEFDQGIFSFQVILPVENSLVLIRGKDREYISGCFHLMFSLNV